MAAELRRRRRPGLKSPRHDMAAPAAIVFAFDLVQHPTLVSVMRQRPLPPDILTLIQIAADAPGAVESAAALTNRSPRSIRAAAIFYIRQVLWADDADCYRILGAAPDASTAKLSEHFRWLMKWLHPDRSGADVRPAFAARVLKAWDTIKTPERRQQYDRGLRRPSASRPRRPAGTARPSRKRVPWIGGSNEKAETPATAPWAIAAAVGAVAIVALAVSSPGFLSGWFSLGHLPSVMSSSGTALAVSKPTGN